MMKRVKILLFSGQVPKISITLLMLLSIISCATLSRRDQHIFELAQDDGNRQISTSNSNPNAQLLGPLLVNEAIDEGFWTNTDRTESSSNSPIVVYAPNNESSDLTTPRVTEIVSIEEQEAEPELVHVQRSWLDRHPKSRNLIATGIMGSAIAYALTSVRKASHMDPVPDSVQHAWSIVNPVAKPSTTNTRKETTKRESDLDSPSFVKRAHGRWRAGALGAAFGGFAMYIHSNKLVPDIKEALWPSRNTNKGNGKRGITEIIFIRDDEDEDEYPQKRAGGKNLAYPLYATAAAVGLYGLHKYNNGGFQTQAQTTMQKRSFVPEESEKEDVKFERRGRGWRDTSSINARVMVSPSHKQIKVYWINGGVARFDRQINNVNGASAGDEQGQWRLVQSFGARAFLPKDRGQLKIIWRSGNITMYDRNGGGQGGPPTSSNNNGPSNGGNQGPGKFSDDFSQPNSAFSSLRMRCNQGHFSLTWFVVFVLTIFLTLDSASANNADTLDGIVSSHGLEKRQSIFRRANTTQGWTDVHSLNAESKISPSHNLVKVIWHSGNVTTYNRTEGQSPPVLPKFMLPDDEPVMWRTVKSLNAKTQLSPDHGQLNVIWHSGNITNFAKLPPNPAPAPASSQPASNPPQNQSQVNNVIPLSRPNTTDNDFNSNQSNNATRSASHSKAGGNAGFAGLLLFWCVVLLCFSDVLAEERTKDRINSADLLKRSNVLAAQTQTDSVDVIERSRLQTGEKGVGENLVLVRRGQYSGWTPLSALPAKSWISPKHDQLRMVRQGGNGNEIFIRDQDTNGPPLPPNHNWQRLRDINAKARLSPDETSIAVRWNSGSITQYIRRETLRKRSLPDEGYSSSHIHRHHRRHVSTADHGAHGGNAANHENAHEHTAKDFQLGRVSPPSHHASYHQRNAQTKHHKNSAHGNLHRRGYGLAHSASWLIVFFAFSVLFFASVSFGSRLEPFEDGLTLMSKRSITQLAGASGLSASPLGSNVPLHFNSVQVNSIPHSTLSSLQGYKSNTARKALRESPPKEPAQAKPPSQKSRLREKRGPGKSATIKREVGKSDELNEALFLKRSITHVSSLAPTSAPSRSPPNLQPSTAFTQDNWPDGNPGKPTRPRNSVAIHDEFVRQYGRKDGIEDPRRELKGGSGARGGGRSGGRSGSRSGPRTTPNSCRRGRGGKCDDDDSSAGKGKTKSAALMAGGAAAGTAIALYQGHGGGGGREAQSSKKKNQLADVKSKKSRLRKQSMSERDVQNEGNARLLIKREFQPALFSFSNSYVLKRSIVSQTGQAVPLSQSNLPSMASSSTSSGLPKSLAAHNAEKVNHYESIAKQYPVNRQMFDDKRASVRDNQLPHDNTLNNRKMLRSGDQQRPKSGKSSAGAVSAGLALTAYGGAKAGQAAADRLEAKSRRARGRRSQRVAREAIQKRSIPFLSSIIKKRSTTSYTGQKLSTSESPLPVVTNKPTSSTSISSSSGLYDSWPDGKPGAPKNLAALHARQRNEYEQYSQLPSNARPSIVQSPSKKNTVSNVGLALSAGLATAGVAVAGYPFANHYINRNRRKRAQSQQKKLNKRAVEIEMGSTHLQPRINPPKGKMEKVILIGSSELLAGVGLIATKAVLSPPSNEREKRDINSTEDDILIERSPISAGAKNVMIGLGSAAAAGGLTMHFLNKDAAKKETGYGVGKIPDQIW